MQNKISLDKVREDFNLFFYENFDPSLQELQISNLVFKKVEELLNEI